VSDVTFAVRTPSTTSEVAMRIKVAAWIGLMALVVGGCGETRQTTHTVGRGSLRMRDGDSRVLGDLPVGVGNQLTPLANGVLASRGRAEVDMPGKPSWAPMQILDLDTGRWRPVPKPPLDPEPIDVTVAATRDGFAMLGRQCDGLDADDASEDAVRCLAGRSVGAIYNSAANSWSELKVPAFDSKDDAETATVGLFGAIDQPTRLVELGSSTFILDISTLTFTRIETQLTRPVLCSIGSEFVNISNPADDRVATANETAPAPRTDAYEGVLIDSKGTATALPRLPDQPLAEESSVLCTGSRVVILGSTHGKRLYNMAFDRPAGRWVPIDPPPLTPSVTWATSTANGALAVTADGQVANFNDKSMSWDQADPALRDLSDGFVVVDGTAIGWRPKVDKLELVVAAVKP
jgi:hypothetical protein